MTAIDPSTSQIAAMLRQPPNVFREHVGHSLPSADVLDALRDRDDDRFRGLSVVLLLIGVDHVAGYKAPEPCLILNKRSQRVRQPGDICCPGGGVEPRIDTFLAHLLRLPGSPLTKWAHYSRWQADHPHDLRHLRLLLATALREGLEEMRLNPLKIRFLGCLPPEPLVMFRRVIQPLVVWVDGQRQFHPNWEVERVVRIPLRALLKPAQYICYRLAMPAHPAGKTGAERLDFPAYRFATAQGTEILWGATYRIAMGFMNHALGFTAPGIETLEVVARELSPQYLTGAG